jgi:hypothetical protein
MTPLQQFEETSIDPSTGTRIENAPTALSVTG